MEEEEEETQNTIESNSTGETHADVAHGRGEKEEEDREEEERKWGLS